MPMTTRPRGADLTLEGVLARLSAHDAVEGVVLMGSTGAETLRPESDYDLLVVLARAAVPLSLACAWIDHRLAEVVFTTAAAPRSPGR